MSEILIHTAPHHPIDVFGLEEEKLGRIRRFFPQLNIILRGDSIKAVGDTAHLTDFEEKMRLVLFHFERFNRLTEADIDAILGESKSENEPQGESETEKPATPLILMGVNGKPVRALTANQQKLV